MKPLFDVAITELKDAHDWPDGWSEPDYRALLHQLEQDDIGELAADELPDMAVMALQDLEPVEAAGHVLTVLLGSKLRLGVRQNMAHQLKSERLYEEYADMEHHAAIFLAAVLLHQAFPRVYPLATIACLTMRVAAANKLADSNLRREPTPAFIARLIGDGIGEHSVLRRLYGEQLAGRRFPEAASIIWRAAAGECSGESGMCARQLEIYSSWYWLRPLKSAPKRYQSAAYEDVP